MTITAELFDGTVLEFPDGTDPAVISRVAKEQTLAKRGGKSPAMAEGMAKLSDMTQNPTVQPQERSTGQMLYDNLIGDPRDGVDSYGEQFGRGFKDIGGAALAGMGRGAVGLAGLPGTLGDLGRKGFLKAGQGLGIIPEDWVDAPPSPLSSGSLIEDLSARTGGASDFKGDSTAAKFAGTIGEFLPGAAALGGLSPANLLKFGALPGATSEAAGQATEGTSWEPWARFGGALAGGLLPGALASGARALVSPNGGANPERLKLAKYLEDAGVPISAGQKVGNEALRKREGITAGGQALAATQKEAFTKAALKTAGTTADRATPDVLKATADRIGSVFEDVTKGVDVTPDPQAMTALSKAVDTYKSLAPTGNQAPIISEVLKAVVKAGRGGNAIPASTVNTWRSRLSKLTTSPDAATRTAAVEALEAVDDMLTSALTSTGRAADVARLAEARGQWRNFLAIQKAASGAGEDAAAGLLSPSALRQSVVRQGQSAYAQGTRGDIADLARAGEGVMKALPESGTPSGWFARIPGGAPGLLGMAGAGTGAMMGPYAAMAGALGGAALPGMAGAARMSPLIQKYLANQLVAPKSAQMLPSATTSLIPMLSQPR